MSKKSAYTRQREGYMRWVRAQKARGITVDLPKPATELQLRKAGLKGSQITKATNQLKKTRARLQDVPAYLTENPQVQGSVGMLQRQQAAERQREAERQQYLADVADSGYETYINVLGDFEEHLNLEPGPRSSKGNWRAESTIEKSRQWRDTVKANLQDAIAANGGGIEGRAAVGALIMQAGQRRCQDLLAAIFMDSSGDAIESAARDLVHILEGTINLQFSLQDNESITAETTEQQTYMDAGTEDEAPAQERTATAQHTIEQVDLYVSRNESEDALEEIGESEDRDDEFEFYD